MTSTTLAFPTPASLGSLDHYIQAVNRFPLLTPEQETALGRALAAATTTSTPPASWCCRTCGWSSPCRRNYLGYGLPQADLIQEGNVGLMKAVRRFDPERGVRLVSFALHWIRAEIHEYILRNWRLVKIATTKAQRKLFFNLRSMKASSAALTARRGAGASRRTLGVKPEEVLEMETRLSRPATWRSTRAPGDEDDVVTPIAYLTDTEDEPAQILEKQRDGAQPQQRAAAPRWPSSTTAAAASSRRAGCARTIRRRCRSWPTSTACPPSGSARSRARR